MSSISLTPLQLQRILHLAGADPRVFWAALSSMGDQYAAAAFQGVAQPQSFYGQVIAAPIGSRAPGFEASRAWTSSFDRIMAYVPLVGQMTACFAI